jgi:hypothetical protein
MFATLKTKAAKIEYVREMLKTNEAWMFRGLVAIYQKQTFDEQKSKVTAHSNGVGFTGSDAAWLSAMAEAYLAKRFFSDKMRAGVKKAMPKYARQLVNIAEEKAIMETKRAA